jgi:MFS family permease
MIDITKKSNLKYLIFGSLYIVEGLQIAIAWVLTPLYLLQNNFSPEIVTLSSGLIMIPWVLKFLFGYFIDSYAYLGKKRLILFSGIISAITLMIASLIDPSSFLIGFILIMFLSHCSLGFFDLSLDSWAIDISLKKERGKISGSMTLGLYTGMMLGNILLGTIADKYYFNIAFFSGGLIILLITLIPLFLKDNYTKKKTKKVISNILSEIKNQKILLFLLFLSFVSLNSGIISLAVPLFMDISLHLDIATIGYISAIFSFSRAAGSFTFGTASDKWGRKKIIFINILITMIITGFLIFINSAFTLTIIYAILGFLTGGLFAVVFALSMDKTNHRIAATQFGIFMAALNIGELAGGSISGTLINIFDFNRAFLYGTWVLGPTIVIFYIIHKLHKK